MANVYMGTDVEDFIFGEGTTYESSVKEEAETVEQPEETQTVEEEVEVTDEELNAFGVIECVDDPEVACYRIALENEQNYNMIMNAFMMKEFSVLESTGSEMIYEAVDVKNFFNLVKETIVRWWGKIQGVIKDVMTKVADRVNLNKNFIKKYKDADIKAPTKEKEFKGYDFTSMKTPMFKDIANLVAKAVDASMISKTDEETATEFIKKFNDDFTSTKNQMRGKACGNATKEVSADDFDKELKVALFGSEEKVVVNLKMFSALLNDLETAKSTKDEAKKGYKEAQDAVKTLLSNVKKAENELKKADRKNAGMKVARCMSDSINASLSIMSKAMSMYSKAMLTKVSQDAAMAMFYVANQPKAEKAKKEEPKNESAIDNMGIVLI